MSPGLMSRPSLSDCRSSLFGGSVVRVSPGADVPAFVERHSADGAPATWHLSGVAGADVPAFVERWAVRAWLGEPLARVAGADVPAFVERLIIHSRNVASGHVSPGLMSRPSLSE